MKKKQISIIISTLNAPQTLLDALRSYFNQNVKPLEVVVVCRSQALEKIQNFIENNNMTDIVKLVKFDGDKNDAKNIGFSKSLGDFIIYADDDMIPRNNLIKECLKVADNFDALIIPEYGIATERYLNKIYSLEKELVNSDPDALTPRFFKRTLFKNNEMPFDKKFGVLDEWGFNLKLKAKKPKVGTIESSFTIIDNSTLGNRIKKNFKKGLWIRNLIKDNKKEGFRRANPIKRGIQFYSSKSNYFKKTPLIFTSLLFIKLLDALSFFLGLFASFTVKSYNDLDKPRSAY